MPWSGALGHASAKMREKGLSSRCSVVRLRKASTDDSQPLTHTAVTG